jgi:mono/diheme cytochrome c family protein
MKSKKHLLILTAVAVPLTGWLLGAKSAPQPQPAQVARGRYLVNFGGCNDCHTPLKMTPKGPMPDMTRMLSGHPQDTKLPPPKLAPGPWFAATAGMTAWTGPWGISYTANLTPDKNTGLGIWTEDMFIKTMRTGRHMGAGRELLPPMPWQSLASLTDEDLKSIFAYLRTIPAIKNQVAAPVPPGGEMHLE